MDIQRLELINRARQYVKDMVAQHERSIATINRLMDGMLADCDHKLPDGRSAYNTVGDQCTICLDGTSPVSPRTISRG